MRRPVLLFLVLVAFTLPACATAQQQPQRPGYTRADTLRGSIGPARSWWDVVFYDLEVRVDPADSSIAGSNAITYRVLSSGSELQIDLQQPLEIDSIVQGGRSLPFRRDGNAFFATLPAAPQSGTLQTVTVHYHGRPQVAENPPWDGGLIVLRDSLDRPWVATANQGLGASVWWPNKDTQAEEPDSQRVAITVPHPMVNVSNGRLRSVINDDSTATFEWFVRNPINNYNIAINAGSYAHFGEVMEGEAGVLTLDYWPLDYNLDAARRQFVQVRPTIACFERWFGPYPWYEDGFKLIETPHLGMEHQSAVAYGNGYQNGYRGRDRSGTGHGLDFDFIIVHETAHEWWGNNITTADLADMWVHEAFGNYAEALYVECQKNERAGAEYVHGLRDGILNDRPIIPEYGVNAEGSGDMYNKGGNMLHTMRQLVGDDDRWREILRGLNSEFRHQVVTGEQVQRYMDERTDSDLAPVFRQYLTTTMIPTLEYTLDGSTLRYRWTDVVDGFAMPVEVRTGPDACTVLRPTSEWSSVDVALREPDALDVDVDYYVQVRRSGGAARMAGADCAGA
ncbi:MAG TPA: M1 family metallopeptidase [Longimicrobiales bacterium]|nr:M1 family metallopeptidase [Longimicrobiales bacterium]